jgi:hypothetical protein
MQNLMVRKQYNNYKIRGDFMKEGEVTSNENKSVESFMKIHHFVKTSLGGQMGVQNHTIT